MSELTMIVTKSPVQISFVNLFEAKKKKIKGAGNMLVETGDPVYTVELRIPKSDTATVAQITAAIDAAKEEARIARWSGKIPYIEARVSGLRDGDVEKAGKPEYAGMYFISCSNKNRPGLLSYECDAFGKRVPITDPVDLFSGQWAYVNISFYGYNNVGQGITTTIHNLLKFKGAPTGFSDAKLSGGPSAEEAFKDFAMGEDDDFMK
jgi:hypothetical protein